MAMAACASSCGGTDRKGHDGEAAAASGLNRLPASNLNGRSPSSPLMDESPLAASRRVKENRWHAKKVEVAPPAPPPLPGQKAGAPAARANREADADIQRFLKDEGPLADGVRRFLQVLRQKRVTLQNEWDVRESARKFVKDYAYAVPNAHKDYIRGMELALKVYLGTKEDA